jgi:hypothetical protein
VKKPFAIALLFAAISAVWISVNSISAPASKIVINSPDQHSSERSGQETPKPDSLGIKLPIQLFCIEGLERGWTVTSVLPDGKMLIGLCDALLMLNSDRSVLWEYHVPQLLLDFAFIPKTGLIYGTAGDNNMFILEATSGRELVRNSRVGSGAYGVVKPYGDDMCLITDNLSGYRDKHNDPSIKDAVTAWRGTEELWSVELPPDADLIVAGSKVLTLTKTKDGIFIKDIDVPTAK